MKWILSREAIIHLAELWHVMCRYWDNKQNISAIVNKIKCYFGIDHEDCTQDGCIADLLLYQLRQTRNHVFNDTNALHGLTLQKSADKHKIPGKNWSLKRQLGAFKKDFMCWRNGNATKLYFNEWRENSDLNEHKVWMEKVDTSKKILPNTEYL